MNINVEGAFVYFTIPIFGGIPISQTTVSSLIVTLLLIFACVKLGKNLKKRPGKVQVMVEKMISMLYGMVGESMGQHNLHWAPFIGAIFASSICGTLIGLTGFFRSVTADLSCTMVWSVMVSVIIWYNNIKRDGVVKWLKGFTEPVAVMTPMNVISEIAQPASMAFRHFGNIVSGYVISALIYAALIAANHALFGLLPGALGGILAEIPILGVGIPAVFSLYFDWFGSAIQAFIFCMLTMIFISTAED